MRPWTLQRRCAEVSRTLSNNEHGLLTRAKMVPSSFNPGIDGMLKDWVAWDLSACELGLKTLKRLCCALGITRNALWQPLCFAPWKTHVLRYSIRPLCQRTGIMRRLSDVDGCRIHWWHDFLAVTSDSDSLVTMHRT